MFNKRGMLMRDYVIILVLFGVIAGIGGLVVSDVWPVLNTDIMFPTCQILLLTLLTTKLRKLNN